MPHRTPLGLQVLDARNRAIQSVNSAMVNTYWLVGREIVEAEQKGKNRAGYGHNLLQQLSKRLTEEFGAGFDESNLRNIRQFYLAYPKRDALRHELSWTHYRILMRVDNEKARSFYEIECAKNRWSARELERQKGTLLFERLALSKDKKGLIRLANKGQEIQKYEDMIKDPYILEFTGLSPTTKLYESSLEQALCDNLYRFLLELGKGFTFVGRQGGGTGSQGDTFMNRFRANAFPEPAFKYFSKRLDISSSSNAE